MTGLPCYGADVITFKSFNPDTVNQQPDELGTYTPMPETDNTVPGCRHRPFRETTHGGAGAAKSEYPGPGVGVSTTWWQSTCPPHPAALAAKASDLISVNGVDYKIIGDDRPYDDSAGRVQKVTFLSERQSATA